MIWPALPVECGPSVFSRAILLLALAASVSCRLFYKDPELIFRGVQLGRFGGDGALLEVSFVIYNPNRYRLEVQSLTYRVRLNGIEAASGAAPGDLVLPARESGTVRLPLSIDWQGLKAAAWEALASGRFNYSVEGEVTFSAPMGTFHRPYRRTGRFGF